jgi:hypothetical protein
MKVWDWLLDRMEERPILIPVVGAICGTLGGTAVLVLGFYLMTS